MSSTKVILGTISCIASDTRYKESRIQMHRKQVDWLEEITNKMIKDFNVSPFPYYRVEQGWENTTKEQLKTNLDYTPLVFDTPIPPGAARNELLKIFYESDADWLICMDDDHGLYNHYHDYQMIWDLTTQPFIDKMCKEKVIITSFPAYWDGYKAEVDKFGRSTTHWFFKATKHPGAMPLACIPNIKKYFGVEVWFDSKAMNNAVSDFPEDLKFQFDWIKSGGKIVEGMMFIGKSLGSTQHSTLFQDYDNRMEIYKSNDSWATKYLKELYPRTPALWSTRQLYKRKNPSSPIILPRYYVKED